MVADERQERSGDVMRSSWEVIVGSKHCGGEFISFRGIAIPRISISSSPFFVTKEAINWSGVGPQPLCEFAKDTTTLSSLSLASASQSHRCSLGFYWNYGFTRCPCVV